jgi:SAM-dependent methyltransferase
MNHVLSRGQMKMTDFLTHEYHRRMNSYDLAYPNSLSFEQPPKFKELIAPTLELAAHPIAREWTRRQEPGWIVDYGCGKGDVLTNLISEGYRIVLFDPDELFVTAHFESMSSWSDIGQESVISISPSSGVLSFVQNSHEIPEVVAVVCSMVVCQLDSEIELKNLLSELYELLPIGGRALINWCCPSLKDVRQFHAHEIIRTINSDPPMYEKKCLKSGEIREEVVWGTEDLLAA